jgi:hypothetical protein
MYLHVAGLGQPGSGSGSGLPGNVVPMPTQPGPFVPPAQMPNPGMPPTTATPTTIHIAVLMNTIDCSAAQRASIAAAVGHPVSATAIKDAIQQAYDGFFLAATDRAEAPRKELLSGSPSATTISFFTQAFGASPTSLPWRGAKSNLGQIVAARLGGAATTMLDRGIRISCYGWPWPGDVGPDRPLDYMVKALPNQERVALGALFWKAVDKGDRESMGSSMLAAGLVIRYGVSYRVLAPPLSNLHCYCKYALSVLGRPIPPWVNAKCPAST